jgi:hypothetical protein
LDILLIGRVILVEEIKGELIGLVGIVEVIEFVIDASEMVIDEGRVLVESEGKSINIASLVEVAVLEIETAETQISVDKSGIEEDSGFVGGHGLMISLGVLGEREEFVVDKAIIIPIGGGKRVKGEGGFCGSEGGSDKLVERGGNLGSDNIVLTVEEILIESEFSRVLAGGAGKQGRLGEKSGRL